MPVEATSAPSARILVIEDHQLLADGLTTALAREGFAVRAVVPHPGSELDLADAIAWQPDVVLLDLVLGPMGLAVDLIPRLRQDGAAVLVCTGHSSRALWGECLAAGAVAVFDKARPLSELIDMVQRVLTGAQVMPVRERKELLEERRRHANDAATRLAPFVSLTHAEEVVLEQLMEGKTAAALAAERTVSIWTVRSHVKSILQKLGVGSQLEAVVMARHAGWKPRSY